MAAIYLKEGYGVGFITRFTKSRILTEGEHERLNDPIPPESKRLQKSNTFHIQGVHLHDQGHLHVHFQAEYGFCYYAVLTGREINRWRLESSKRLFSLRRKKIVWSETPL